MQLRFYRHESSAHQSNLADEIIACGRFSILRSNSRTASEPSYCLDDSTTKATANNALLKPSIPVPPQAKHHRRRWYEPGCVPVECTESRMRRLTVRINRRQKCTRRETMVNKIRQRRDYLALGRIQITGMIGSSVPANLSRTRRSCRSARP